MSWKMDWYRVVLLERLRPTNLWAYNSIWRALRREEGYSGRFSNLGTPALYGWPWDIIGVGDWRKFVITQDGLHVGVAAVVFDRRNAVCGIELGLLAQYRGQGLGSYAGRLLIRKCFVEFAARRVEATALSSNPASVKMHDWMLYEGTLKSRFLLDGLEVNELLYRILRPEWEAAECRLYFAKGDFNRTTAADSMLAKEGTNP
jgi:RimJ/RimL family protein N-acetyltransferase